MFKYYDCLTIATEPTCANMTVAVCFALGDMVTKVSGRDAILREGEERTRASGHKEDHV